MCPGSRQGWISRFFVLKFGKETEKNGSNIKDNVRATMAENKILNVGRTSLEIEARTLSCSARFLANWWHVNESEFESESRLYIVNLARYISHIVILSKIGEFRGTKVWIPREINVN